MSKSSIKPRIMVADDHAVIIKAVRSVLDQEGFDLVAEEVDPSKVVDRYLACKPDALILDVGFSGSTESGFDILTKVLQVDANARVLIYSQLDQIAAIRRGYKAGCKGYVTKRRDPDILALALKKMLAGEVYFMDGIADQLALSLLSQATAAEVVAAEVLNAREMEVFIKLANGLTGDEIAAALDISAKTVGITSTRVKEKLGVRRSADLTKIAFREGLIS